MWIQRRFLIRSHGNLSLVNPNNKTLEHWRLKVTFIITVSYFLILRGSLVVEVDGNNYTQQNQWLISLDRHLHSLNQHGNSHINEFFFLQTFMSFYMVPKIGDFSQPAFKCLVGIEEYQSFHDSSSYFSFKEVKSGNFEGVMKRAACCRPRKRQPSTSTLEKCRMVDIDHCLFLLVDVNHHELFYGQRCH